MSNELPGQKRPKEEQEKTLDQKVEGPKHEDPQKPAEESVEVRKKETKEMPRLKIEDVVAPLRGLSSAFGERMDQRLNPLLDEQGVSNLRAGALMIESLEGRKGFDEEAFRIGFGRVLHGLEAIGSRRELQVRESEDNLSKLMSRLRGIEDGVSSLRNQLAGLGEETQGVTKILARIEEVSAEKRRAIGRKREAFRDLR